MKQNTMFDLTSGSVPKRLFRFALPLFLANILQSCYSMADMAVVGNFVGSGGLAAAASASKLLFLITSLGSGLTMGGTVLIAHSRGGGRRDQIWPAAGNLFTGSLLTALAITIFTLLVYPSVFQFMSVPSEIMPLASSYMHILCFGTVFVFGYNACCAILRGLGDSSGPLKFVAFSSVLNILLDLLLTGVCGFGMQGAALATVFSQAASGAVAVIYLWQRGMLKGLKRTDLCLQKRVSIPLLRIGLPSAVQMSVLNLSYLLVTGMLNGCGVAVAAAAGVGLNLNTFAAMPCWAVGQAVTTMTGQNLGAGNIRRAASTAKTGVWMSVAVTAPLVLIIQIFAPQLIGLFNADPAVIREGAYYLHLCCGLNFLPYTVMYLLDSFATGTGDSRFAMLNALFQSVVLRLGLSVLLGNVLGWGYPGICLAEAVSPILPAILGLGYFFGGRWKKTLPPPKADTVWPNGNK